ncbi:hypothetical protein P8452_53502 [Trifolium repens]|nr:hypothetical protein P8452_36099 [Trifolium repens]WJX69227.1 hypothetical protein P8452_53502 [Trifolium repens]
MFWKHLFQPPSEIADPEIVDIVLKTPWDFIFSIFSFTCKNNNKFKDIRRGKKSSGLNLVLKLIEVKDKSRYKDKKNTVIFIA